MAHYVLADVHGEAARFHAMLERISPAPSDTLYILGDVIDRGPDGILLLQEIMEMPNAVMLLGNHEYMMMQYLVPDATELDHRRWNRNGNAPTLAAYVCLPRAGRERLLDFLSSLPSHLDLTVGGTRFHLVHGFPADNVHDEVWLRPRPDTPAPLPGTQVIIGHTNIVSLCAPEKDYDGFVAAVQAHGEHLRMFHGDGFIDIDCGCGYDLPVKTLACLRLEDMQEFYV